MKSRPLKVGEYRKVKTWEQLLATEGFKECSIFGWVYEEADNSHIFCDDARKFCGKILLIDEFYGSNVCKVKGDNRVLFVVAEFFTDDYYDENGNEVKMEEDVELIEGVTKVKCIRNDCVDLTIDKIYTINRLDLDEVDNPFSVIDDSGVEAFYIKSRFQILSQLDPLDQLEATTKQDIAKSNKVLDQIALMREIDLKQAEIDQLIEAQDKRIEEYGKGATHE